MSKTSLDLTGKWEFKEYPLSARRMRDLDSADWQPADAPSSIFNCLIAAGQIKQGDIYTCPEKFLSVSEKPWVFRKTFDAPAELLDCDQIDLLFDGLDTVAAIWLNNKLIGKTNNMFIPFRFNVTKILKPQSNSLLVKFEPAVPYAKNLMQRYIAFDKSAIVNPHRAYIRKAQYQFGWDFCPSLPGCGIWRPVRLEGIKKAAIAEVYIRTVDCNHRYADIKIITKLNVVTKENFLCRLTLAGSEQTIEHNLTFNAGEDSHSTVIRIENPSLWWPAGYGQQHLYRLELELLSGSKIIDQTQKNFGIRTVKLNRSADKYGENFQFEINSQPVFAKGTNWIPISMFAGSAAGDDYQKLLYAAAKSNINMLRVWGGGYYESEEFYKLCDQLGIMVWQDFMFASSYYPDRKWFLEEVKKETTVIIQQLRNHPSLVLWCGNNEIDQLHHAGKLGKGKKFHGRIIYHQLLPKLVAELDPDTDYIPTSPLPTKVKFNASQLLTIHQPDAGSGHQLIHQYQCSEENIPRFVAEFGLQSLPAVKSIKDFCPAEQLRIGSEPIEKHNYQLEGNSRLYRCVGDLFATAKSLEQFVYFSQVTQARSAKTYVEYLRAHNFTNRGVLFRQFNDCFPAISPAAIDHAKKPKALYYYAKRFFANLLVTVVPEFDKPKANQPPAICSLNAFVINDTPEVVTATLSCRLIDLHGHRLDHVVFPVVIGPFSTSPPLKLPKAIVFPPQPANSALHLVMEKENKKLAENLFFYLPDKYIDWPDVQIEKQLSHISDKQWKLMLKSNAVAKDVQISSAECVQLGDNFIDLTPDSEIEIIIDCERQITAASLQSLLQIRSTKPLSRK